MGVEGLAGSAGGVEEAALGEAVYRCGCAAEDFGSLDTGVGEARVGRWRW